MPAKTSTSQRLWKSETARVKQMRGENAGPDMILKTVKISIDNHTDFSGRGVPGKMTRAAADRLWKRLQDFINEPPELRYPPGDLKWTAGWPRVAFKLRDEQLARIMRMRKAGSRQQTMEDAVWLTIQTHTHRDPSDKGHVPEDIGTAVWLYLLPFISGNGPERSSKGRYARIPVPLRAKLDAAKDQRREDYFRAGLTYEGGPIHDPIYEHWLIGNDIDPVAYLARFDPEDGWEAPPWAAKYGVFWGDDLDGDEPCTTPDPTDLDAFRELVTA